MSAPVRLLDLGPVTPLRSQALYHALAEGMGEDSPDTIALCRPAAPYFCVGYHQVPREELDLDWCRDNGYPVLQRRIGGGTVFLDPSQLFYQCVFHRRRAPLMVEAIYRRYLMPAVEALRALGLPAALEGVNEIEVGGRRIAGTGGGQIGEAVVVTGNILFDFDYAAMARAWRVPSEGFRRLAADGLRCYVTTLKRELPGVPTAGEVSRLLADKYAEALDFPLVPGALTTREEEAIARAEEGMAAPVRVSTGRAAGRSGRGLKIARGVYVREEEASTPAGPVRLTLRVRGGVIDDLILAGPVCSRPRVAEAARRAGAGGETVPREPLPRAGGGTGGEGSQARSAS
ncbi:MAG TPA: biotin/lipoate A/B protein ligase family protein [Methylomirabilota bacterium]|nr:biotin/lipoate A/B protein ligase family protein [Methylomirabilota bacterium]